jgi:VCBS repeat-containing protein
MNFTKKVTSFYLTSFAVAALFIGGFFVANNAFAETTTLVGWDFPNDPDNEVADSGLSVNSSKTITAVGIVNLKFDNSGFSTRSASAKSWDDGANVKNWQIEFDATGYDNIKVSSKQRSSDKGPRDFKLQYKIASGEWMDVSGGSVVVGNNWTSGVINNVNLPAEANDRSSVFVRWIMTSDRRVESDDTVKNDGTSRIDDVLVTGTLIVNSAPIAQSQSIITNEDTATSSVVYATDSDGPSALVYSKMSDPAHGTITAFDTATGVFTYVPETNYNGSDSFKFQAYDGKDYSDETTVSITINAVNDTPSFTLGTGPTVSEDAGAQSMTGFVTNINKGDGNESAQTLTFSVSDNNPGLFTETGRPAISDSGALTFTPAENQNGFATVTVSLSDNGGGANTSGDQTFTIAVGAVNDVPNTNKDTFTIKEDATFVAGVPGVLENDTDVENDALTAVLVSTTTNGVLDLNQDGSFVYTPNADFNGLDSFEYRAKDTELGNIVTVTIDVAGVNDVPAAKADSYETNEDTILTVETSGGVLKNDTDTDNDALSAVLVDSPTYGTVELHSDGSFIYTPKGNSNEEDHFTYKAIDGKEDGDSGEAVVTIAIKPVNDVPVAVNQTGEEGEVTTPEDSSVTITLSATDMDSSTLTYVIVPESGPEFGTLGEIDGNKVVYTPKKDWNGVVSFNFIANDSALDSEPAKVSVRVQSSNDVPVIEILGDNPAKLFVDDTYVDGGVKVTDVDYDGTITATNDKEKVDTSKVGEYTVTYTATDGEATTTAARLVKVTAKQTSGGNGGGNNDGGNTGGGNGGAGVAYFGGSTVSSNSTPTMTMQAGVPTISWTTDHDAYGHVVYGKVSGAPYTLDLSKPHFGYQMSTPSDPADPFHIDTAKTSNHSIILNGLVAGETYYYRVVSHASPAVVSEEYSFVAPKTGTTSEVIPNVVVENGADQTVTIVTADNSGVQNVVPKVTTQKTKVDIKATSTEELAKASTTEGDKKVSNNEAAAVGFSTMSISLSIVFVVVLSLLGYVVYKRKK